MSDQSPWWKEAVVYQVYPRSFADGNGDGVGDLYGVLDRVDYLAWLGVDAVWISPIYPSPMADNGYDISDYRNVDPVFGDLETFDRLLAALHERGIRLLLDFVPNHTSDQHPWFVDSRSSRESAHRGWYFWRDGTPEHPPNNWLAAFGGSAWTLDETTGQMYLHLFLPEQPDLNWNNPSVVEAMHGNMRFWLDRGVDGFRVDVVHCIGKNPDLPDQPASMNDVDRVAVHDYEGTHGLIRGMRDVLDSYPGDRMMVGEVTLRQTEAVARYYGDQDELNLAFNFLSLDAGWSADAWRRLLDHVPAELGAAAWPTWVLSNHDNSRHRTRMGGSERRARATAVLLLTLRGTPFMYYGAEIGMEDAVVSAEHREDPGGRDAFRAPLPWDGSPDHGWPGVEPWLPWPPEPDVRNVADQRADPGSILNLYQRLLTARRGSTSLRRGEQHNLLAPGEVIGFQRVADGEQRAVLVNFGAQQADVPLDGEWCVEIASDGAGEGKRYEGSVPGESAVLLTPGQ